MGKYTIGGEVAAGYESVQLLFDKFFQNGMEECAQLCVYVKGEKVVDLHGARLGQDGSPIYDYDGSSVQNIFSSSKTITSLVLAMLVDRGLLSYDQLVTDIWPEFSKNGKTSPTIAELAKHESGLPNMRVLDAEELSREAIKDGHIASLVEEMRQQYEPGERRVYHLLSRGCILNEITQRVDSQGRTIGEFIRDEIAGPLGLEDTLVLGIQPDTRIKVAPVSARSYTWTWAQVLLPSWAGGGGIYFESLGDRLFVLLGGVFLAIFSVLRIFCGPRSILGVSSNNGRTTDVTKVFNSPEMRRAELPSANMHASARALARLALTIVERGADSENSIISPEGIQSGLGDAETRKLTFQGIKVPTCFTNAGWNYFFKQRYDFVGWMGFGGSTMQWQDEERIAFGYAMTSLERVRFDGWRSKFLQKEVLRCAKRVSKDITDEPFQAKESISS